MEIPDKIIDQEINHPKFEFREMTLDYRTLFSYPKFFLPLISFIIGIVASYLSFKFDSTLSMIFFIIIGLPTLVVGICYTLWPFVTRLVLPLIMMALLLLEALILIPQSMLATIRLKLIEGLLGHRN
ncbi:MAG: hypothetical protein NTX61_02410 [Bacteroidetes bacterium]|nr:hypothetical protein [Bacteroidota bacterium]